MLRRLGDAARRRGIGPSEPAPGGLLDSLEEWTHQHREDGAGWLAAPLPGEPALLPARSVSPAGEPLFAAALRSYRTRVDMRAARAEVAIVPQGRLVSADGIVITPDDLVARESAWDDQHLADTGLVSEQRLPVATSVEGAAASLISRWCDAYYHWITDALPRLRILELAGVPEVPLVVPAALTSWQRRSLELLGIPSEQLRRHDGRALRAERLLWPRPAAVTGHTPAWACAWLRERLGAPTQARTRKLYVTRRRERSRRVSNEHELSELLASYGFEQLDPGALPLDEQIQAFSEASVIVGPHGGGLTNLVFAQRAVVVELFEPSYVNPCFYALATRSGHRYWYLIGRTESARNIVVDLPLVEQTLAQADVARADSPPRAATETSPREVAELR